MNLANILVHVDSKPRTAARLALATVIAERAGAQLTGIFAEKADAHTVGSVASWPSPNYTAALEQAHTAFEVATRALGARAAFLDLNRGSDQEIGRRFVEIARTFDLVVLGQTHDAEPVPARLPEQTIYESGRPVLVVPFVGSYPDVGQRPLFAWHNSRGAARAVFDVLPLIANEADALVVEVARKSDQRDEFADMLVASLATHGVKARYQHFVVDEVAVMDTLLSAVSDHAADILAIGAFDQGTQSLLGHGAGTRHILAHMTAPVLFSH
jgi:nucleotide-binding universal stress UspA family protein